MSIVCTEDSLVSRYMAHVRQFAKMREYVKAVTEKAKLDEKNNTSWTKRMIV